MATRRASHDLRVLHPSRPHRDKWDAATSLLHGLLNLVLLATAPMLLAAPPSKGVNVTTSAAAHRVDITIDGKPFTSYLWETNQRKPVLYPIVAPDGTIVTRGYPFDTRPGERVDHPHHAGLWFNYGNANGFDFWNNSDAIKPADAAKYGTIHHERIVSTHSGAASGDLTVESTWTTATGQNILAQTTRYVFAATPEGRTIDLTVTLKALDKVVFNDDKEGLLGLRVAHFLESPTEKAGMFMDANGVPTQVAAADPAGATGVYRTSEGRASDAPPTCVVTGREGDSGAGSPLHCTSAPTADPVWGTRGRWCELSGTTADGGHPETIAILDHSDNPGYPTYWHARGYGLFATNPLGPHIFDPKAAALNLTLEKGRTATFRYRVLIASSALTPGQLDHAANLFDPTHH